MLLPEEKTRGVFFVGIQRKKVLVNESNTWLITFIFDF